MNKRKAMNILPKPNEMEMITSYQAMRLTWIIVNIIWVGSIVVFLINGNGGFIISTLTLLVAEVIYFITMGILRWRMTRGGEDNE
jgi:hypothetical protein